MATGKITIEHFLELAKQQPVIDVRSPAEYKHAHIPGAINIPLFTDEERKLVGTAYKQKSREEAIKIGLDFFGPKMRPIIQTVESILSQPKSPNTELLIYCWRGGMRSAAIAWLLDMYGFRVNTLAGGYKRFRNYVLDIFKLPLRLRLLGGFTGSGKTELLKYLEQKGESVIDLEAIARHKGSAFGSIGMPAQPTQEMFENELALALSGKKEELTWLEDESQRIGHVNIPPDLWKNMRSSPVYFLDIPFEERLKHITEEYGCLDRQRMTEAITRIREKLGGLNARTAIRFLEEGNTIESFRILLEYYDRFYFKSLHNRQQVNSLLQRIETKSVSPENAALLIHQSQSHFQEL